MVASNRRPDRFWRGQVVNWRFAELGHYLAGQRAVPVGLRDLVNRIGAKGKIRTRVLILEVLASSLCRRCIERLVHEIERGQGKEVEARRRPTAHVAIRPAVPKV
jgi:hypothetical protein